MKKLSIKLGVLFFAFALFSCETEMIERFDELNFETGGYMRTVTPFPIPTFSVSKANMAGTKMEMLVEAVTPEFGANFDTYDLVIRFLDKTAANGTNNKSDVPLKSYPSSVYTKDPATGYPRTTISITGKDMQDALKLTLDQIAKGDQFEIRGTMKLKDGRSFNASNSDPDITGTNNFYSSPFLYKVNVAD